MIDFIAEFTTNHMGNLNVLLRMVEQAAASGASWIKMQKKDVESFYSQDKLNSEYISPYGKTYREYRTIFEFDKEDFERFDRKCKECGIKWFSTVQDIASLHWMLEFKLEMYKIASCNAGNADLLRAVADQIPESCKLVISMAGRTLEQIEETISYFPSHNLFLLHCVAEYPCAPAHLRLGNIKKMMEVFGSDRIQIGYSGHEEGIYPSLVAADFGAKMIERHFCLSRHTFVHHIECSLEPQEFKDLVHTVANTTDLEACYKPYLPPVTFETQFGMSDMEKSFLVDQTYGDQYLREHPSTQFQA